MNTAGYMISAVGVTLLLCPAGTGLRLLLGSNLRGMVWVLMWWAMANGLVEILDIYAPTHTYRFLEQLVNPLLALLSWLAAYSLNLLLLPPLRVNEGGTRILISMIGALAFWRVVIYEAVAGAGEGITPDSTVTLTCVLSLLLMLLPPLRRVHDRNMSMKMRHPLS